MLTACRAPLCLRDNLYVIPWHASIFSTLARRKNGKEPPIPSERPFSEFMYPNQSLDSILSCQYATYLGLVRLPGSRRFKRLLHLFAWLPLRVQRIAYFPWPARVIAALAPLREPLPQQTGTSRGRNRMTPARMHAKGLIRPLHVGQTRLGTLSQ